MPEDVQPPRDRVPSSVDPQRELGLTGLRRTYTGSVDEEFLPPLAQRKDAIRVYKEMSQNDPVVGAILFGFDMNLRQVEWRVEANEQAPDPEGEAEFLRQNMDDMSHTWPDFISEVLTFLPFGFSMFETVYKLRNGPQSETARTPTSKYSDGRIGWRKFAIRSQDTIDRWVFDPQDGGLKGYVQVAPPDYKEVIIPVMKSLLFRTTTVKGNPEGISVLRNAYRPWYFKKRIEEIEAIGIERDLAGLPIAYVDSQMMRDDASDADKAVLETIKKIVANIKRDREEGVVWPMAYDADGHQMFDLRLLNSGGSRTFDTSSIVERYDRRITMSVLADFIMLGHQGVGSFALSDNKTDMFAVAMGAWLRNIEGVLNQYAVPRLWELNGFDPSTRPKLIAGDIEKPDLTVIAAYLQGLTAAGMPLFPNDKMQEHLLGLADLPLPEDEEKEEAERNKKMAEGLIPVPGQEDEAGGGDQQEDQQEAPTNGSTPQPQPDMATVFGEN